MQNTGVCLEVGCAILHKVAVFRWDDRLPVDAVYPAIIHRIIADPMDGAMDVQGEPVSKVPFRQGWTGEWPGVEGCVEHSAQSSTILPAAFPVRQRERQD